MAADGTALDVAADSDAAGSVRGHATQEMQTRIYGMGEA
jgi:hypothetical protein